MSTGRKPDYRVGAMSAETNARNGNIGAAWINPDGSIYIKLEPFLDLRQATNITLFRTDVQKQVGLSRRVVQSSEKAENVVPF